MDYRRQITSLLGEENKLMEIVKLIGADVLPDYQKLILEVAKVIRVGFLQQNAFHKDDTYVPMAKQFKMMEVILYLYKKAKNLVDFGVPVNFIRETGLFDSLVKIKYEVPNDHLEQFEEYFREIDRKLESLSKPEASPADAEKGE